MGGGGDAVERDVSEETGQTTALTCRGLLVVADSGTALAEDKDGNGTRERRRPCAQSHCAQVCALAPLRDDLPDSVTCHRVAAQNRSRQILW